MYSHAGQEAGPSRMINQAELSPGLSPGNEEDVSTLMWDDEKLKKGMGSGGSKGAPQGNKCFNCSQDGHSIKDYHKLKNQCEECKFHRGGHRCNCLKFITRVCTTTMEQATTHSLPTIHKDPFTAIRGMNFDQLKAYFWDMKDLQEKQGKGKAQ